MAIAESAARKLLRGDPIARGVADVGGISFGLWDLITGFFANILASLFAALVGVVHLLVLPLEMLWQWLVTLIATAAGAISSGLDGLRQHVTGFFAGIFAGLAGAAHQLVLPLETLCQWIATTAADAAGSISSGLDGLWQLVTGFFPGILAHLSAALTGAAHELESLWHRLLTNVADAAGSISFHVDGLWQLVAGFFPKIFAALAGAAHEIPQELEESWRWIKTAAVVALPFVLGVAVVLLLVALIWWGACALVYLGNVVVHVTVSVAGTLVSCLLHPCAQCSHVVTMNALSAVAVGACRELVNAFSSLLPRRAVSLPAPTMSASPFPSAVSPPNEAAPSPSQAPLPPPRLASQPPVVAAAEEGELVEDDTEVAGKGVEADCCCVCMARPEGAAFMPCGHTLCRACAGELHAGRGRCPLCNADIDGVLDIF